MTEVAPTDLLNTPLTPEQAGAQLAALRADPEFLSRWNAKDADAIAENTRLYRVSIGMTPEPQAPINTMDVMTETVGRELQDVQRRADNLRADGFNENQVYAVLNDAPMSLAQRQYHEREIQRLRSDQTFVQKLLAGDITARGEMRRHTAALTLRVGTPAEIDAWARAHAGKQPANA